MAKVTIIGRVLTTYEDGGKKIAMLKQEGVKEPILVKNVNGNAVDGQDGEFYCRVSPKANWNNATLEFYNIEPEELSY